MTRVLSVATLALGILGLGTLTLSAQEAGHSNAASYQCAEGAHCAITCTVDGEKQVQTGNPKTVTMTPLGPSSYLLELVEQSGHTLFSYLTGAKIVCIFDGLTKPQ